MKERIEQASDILFKTTDGLEDELVAYQKAAAKTLYREIEQSASIGFESVSSVNKLSEASITNKKNTEAKDRSICKGNDHKMEARYAVSCALRKAYRILAIIFVSVRLHGICCWYLFSSP